MVIILLAILFGVFVIFFVSLPIVVVYNSVVDIISGEESFIPPSSSYITPLSQVSSGGGGSYSPISVLLPNAGDKNKRVLDSNKQTTSKKEQGIEASTAFRFKEQKTEEFQASSTIVFPRSSDVVDYESYNRTTMYLYLFLLIILLFAILVTLRLRKK